MAGHPTNETEEILADPIRGWWGSQWRGYCHRGGGKATRRLGEDYHFQNYLIVGRCGERKKRVGGVLKLVKLRGFVSLRGQSKRIEVEKNERKRGLIEKTQNNTD